MATVNNILITGASGLIGTRMTKLLQQQGNNVSHLGRRKSRSQIPSFTWNIVHGKIDPEALQQADTILHLAGATVSKRWTTQRKQEILHSRTKSTQLLYESLEKKTGKIKTVVSASGMSYYGFGNGEEIFAEDSPASTDFLSGVTRQWESEVDKIGDLGIRVVKLRIGIVLSREGGALKKIASPIKFFAGAPLGSGEQYMNWIHIDDLCEMFIKAIKDENMAGPYNAVSPNPVTNREMTNAIAKILHRPLILPAVPAFVLKMMLGEMSDLVLKGSQVSAEKIVKTGFKFKFPTLEKALQDVLI